MAEFSCLLCADTAYTTVAPRVRDSAEHSVVRCQCCGHVQLFPVPSDAELMAYYQAKTQRRSVPSDITREQQRRHVQADTTRRAGRLIMADVHIDVGAVDGFLAELVEAQGSEVYGVDLCIPQSQEKLPAFPVPAFTDVTLFHVLEHVRDPCSFLANWWKYVGSAGCLMIEVPNHEDWLIATCPAYAAWHYQLAHLHYFTVRSLWQVLNQSAIDYPSIELFGVQRYSLGSARHWQQYGTPLFETPIGACDDPDISEECDAQYRKEKENTLTADTLFVVLKD